ncbi:HIT-like domain-containing protein [Biscogniauxia marginata]|nr:HIT-like domain-containing protein [Biscogniauxia marginata]
MIKKGGMTIFLNSSAFNSTIRRNMTSSSRPAGPVYFGPYEVTTQVFLTTPHSFALVNLKPLLPGHVLVCPARRHPRLTDLSAPELTDLFLAVQRVQRMLARHYFSPSLLPSSPGSSQPSSTSTTSSSSSTTAITTPDAGSFNLAIQDGAEAGQTVPHVHVHVIPRIRGATAKDEAGPGDEIYELMAAEDGNVGGALWDRESARRPKPGGAFPRIEDQNRSPRSMAEMEAEADLFRRVLRQMEAEEGLLDGDGDGAKS